MTGVPTYLRKKIWFYITVVYFRFNRFKVRFKLIYKLFKLTILTFDYKLLRHQSS